MINKQFTLAGRPVGRPIEDSDFEYKESEIGELNENQVLLENLVIEFQPAQKGWMEQISNYVENLLYVFSSKNTQEPMTTMPGHHYDNKRP